MRINNSVNIIHTLRTTLLLSVCILVVSCNRGTVMNETYEVPSPEWNYNEPICYDMWIEDTSTGYDLTFSIRHSNDFEWQNAFFLIRTVFPDMEVSVDTLECILAEPDGRWIGNRSGKYYRIGFLYKQGIRFPQAGEYRFEIRHAMRDDNLQGIRSIGLKVQRT